MKLPPNLNYSEPAQQGLYGARNFYVTHSDDGNGPEVRLGAWHTLPRSLFRLLQPTIFKDLPEGALSNMTRPLEGVQSTPAPSDDDFAARGHLGLAYKVNKLVSVMGYAGGASGLEEDFYGMGRVVVAF